MSERYGVTTLEALATPAIPGQARWHTIRKTLGVASFGQNWSASADRSHGDGVNASPGLAPTTRIVVPSSPTAPRLTAGSATCTRVPAGASTSSPSSVNVARPVTTM